MDTSKQNNGFGVIAVLLAVLVIAVAGYVGWRVWSTTGGTNNTDVTSSDQSQSSDPYVGWKIYCDPARKACFKYPADWTVNDHNNSGFYSATLTNKTNAAEVDYSGNFAVDARDANYTIVSVEKLAQAGSSWNVVGRIFTSGDSTALQYQLIDQDQAAALKVGQIATMPDTARFTFSDGTTGHLVGYATTSDPDVEEAKVLGLILKSFYLE